MVLGARNNSRTKLLGQVIIERFSVTRVMLNSGVCCFQNPSQLEVFTQDQEEPPDLRNTDDKLRKNLEVYRCRSFAFDDQRLVLDARSQGGKLPRGGSFDRLVVSSLAMHAMDIDREIDDRTLADELR